MAPAGESADGEGTEHGRAELLAALTHKTLAEVGSTASPDEADTAEPVLDDANETSERLLRLLIAHSADMLIVVNEDAIIMFASPSVERTLGHDPRSLIGRNVFDFIDPNDSSRVFDLFERSLGQNLPPDVYIASVLDGSGKTRWVETLTVGLLDEPAIKGFVVTLRDITDRVHAEERAEVERLRFRTLVDSMPDVVVRLDTDLHPVYGNAAALALESNWLSGGKGSPRRFAEQPAPASKTVRELKAVLETGETRSFETVLSSDGGEIWLSSIAVPELDHLGGVTGVLVVTRDVTVYRARHEELAKRALEDPLTGLANRSRLEAELERSLHGMSEAAAPVGILFADLDGFKEINDQHGHSVGDKLLQTFSRRARDGLRPSDLVARFGGDEFVVLPNRLHIAAELESLAARLHQVVLDPFEIDGRLLTISLSIGIAATSASRPITASELIRRADQAMYASKRQGRDQTTVWSPAVDASGARSR